VEALALAKDATQPHAAPDRAAAHRRRRHSTRARALLARRAGTRLLDIGPAGHGNPFAALPAAQSAHLPKPFALSQLLKVVRSLLDT